MTVGQILQVFDFHTLTWSSVHLKMEPPVPNVSGEHLFAIYGHVVVSHPPLGRSFVTATFV